MNLKKYNELRDKLEKKTFEGKNESLSRWLYYFSFFGNVGSIFFAIFFVYPIFLKAITYNISNGQLSKILSIIISVIILIVFEYLKRKIITNLSFDLIKYKFKIFNSIGLLLSGLVLIMFSFYFSLNGAKEFVSSSDKYIMSVNFDYKTYEDSIKHIFLNEKQPYINENNSLRNINEKLRISLLNTPSTYRTVREGYQNNIDKNQELINKNLESIKMIDNEFITVMNEKKNDITNKIEENGDDDKKNILLFILLSTFIELIIIAGVSYREYYDIYVYNINKDKLEPIYLKRKRYLILINFLYNDGKNGEGSTIMGIKKLKDLVKEKSKITNPNKFVDEFIVDVTKLGIVRISGNKRILNMEYDDAVEIINKFDDTLRILKELI